MTSPPRYDKKTAMTMYKSLPEKDKELLPVVRAIAREAGRVIMRVYNEAASNDNAMQTEIKADNSPVTIADKLSSERSVDNMPTCAVFSLEFDITRWDELVWATGINADFDYPKKA